MLELYSSSFSSRTRSFETITILLRLITTILLSISFLLLVINVKIEVEYVDRSRNTLYFYNVVGYRYMASAIIFGIGYLVFQILVTLKKKTHEETAAQILFNWVGDKILSFLVATGGVAGFIATGEKQQLSKGASFSCECPFRTMYASASVLLVGFIFSTVLSFISSYSLNSHQPLLKSKAQAQAQDQLEPKNQSESEPEPQSESKPAPELQTKFEPKLESIDKYHMRSNSISSIDWEFSSR